MTAEQIKTDLDRYMQGMMMSGGHSLCLAIERRYGLDGYPPQIVTAALVAGADGKDMHDAVDRLLSGED